MVNPPYSTIGMWCIEIAVPTILDFICATIVFRIVFSTRDLASTFSQGEPCNVFKIEVGIERLDFNSIESLRSVLIDDHLPGNRCAFAAEYERAQRVVGRLHVEIIVRHRSFQTIRVGCETFSARKHRRHGSVVDNLVHDREHAGMIISPGFFIHVPRHIHVDRLGLSGDRCWRARRCRFLVMINKLLSRPAFAILQFRFISSHFIRLAPLRPCMRRHEKSDRSSTSRQIWCGDCFGCRFCIEINAPHDHAECSPGSFGATAILGFNE